MSRIGFISTRLEGTDGVSLETAKIATIVKHLGHQVFYCAGKLDPGLVGSLIPEMLFTHPEVQLIQQAAFQRSQPWPGLHTKIDALAEHLESQIAHFVRQYEIDLLFIQNALAIPMNLALGVALTRFIEQTGIPAIAHHHDFSWERGRFERSQVPDILASCFPPVLPSLRHVAINSLAQHELRRRRGVDSVVLPNIFDFAHAAPGMDMFNRDLRQDLGLSEGQLLILQPTRVVPRKGIELSIELVRRLLSQPDRLGGRESVLVLSHHAGDEGMDYLETLQGLAQKAGVQLIYAAGRFAPRRAKRNGQKTYSLWDAYVHADFVTYPSLIEGFGNALIETLYFQLPAMVNRYAVYQADIGPLGFDLVEIDGKITARTVELTIQALMDPVRRRRMAAWNYQLAREHFSYEAVTPALEKLLDT